MKFNRLISFLALALSFNLWASDKEFVCNASYTISKEDSNSRSFIEIKSFDGTYDSRNLHEVFATDLEFFNDFNRIAAVSLKSPESKSEFTILIKKALDRPNNFGVFSISVSQNNYPATKKDINKTLFNSQGMFEINKLNALNGLYLESKKSGINQIFVKCFIRQK
ncbi:MAG: hypothetical protein U0T83_07075 [Bacteriovoracaceae bacterium]